LPPNSIAFLLADIVEPFLPIKRPKDLEIKLEGVDAT
jgi:hypothetical protein